MKVIVAGSRDLLDYPLVKEAIERSGFTITELVSGGARGVDTLGEKWAKENNIPVKRFPANWNLHGRGAGPIRNREMAEYADACIALALCAGPGTKNMIRTAESHKLLLYVHK